MLVFRFSNFIIFYFFLSCMAVVGINASDQAEKADQLYKEKKFDFAMQSYEQIPNKDFHINYNLGNCAYELGKDGLAMLYWRRAESDWSFFGRGELLDKISLLQRRLFKKNKEVNYFVKLIYKLKNYSISMIRLAPVFVFQFSFLILWFILFFFLRILYKKRKKFVIVSLFSFILLFGIALVMRHHFDLSRYGVIVTHNAVLLSAPRENVAELGFIPEAKEVIINKTTDDFFKIKFNGQVGWVKKDDIKKIII